MTTLFSIPTTAETRIETLTTVMEQLFAATGKTERVNAALKAAGKTMQDVARDHSGPLPISSMLIPGIEQPVLLGAKISFLDESLIVSIERDNPLAIRSFEANGYNKVSETQAPRGFTGKRGLHAVLAGGGTPDTSHQSR